MWTSVTFIENQVNKRHKSNALRSSFVVANATWVCMKINIEIEIYFSNRPLTYDRVL